MTNFWKQFFIDNIAPETKKARLQKELVRLNQKKEGYQITLDGLNNFIMNPSNKPTGFDMAQVYACQNNIRFYENEIADVEARLLLLDIGVNVG